MERRDTCDDAALWFSDLINHFQANFCSCRVLIESLCRFNDFSLPNINLKPPKLEQWRLLSEPNCKLLDSYVHAGVGLGPGGGGDGSLLPGNNWIRGGPSGRRAAAFPGRRAFFAALASAAPRSRGINKLQILVSNKLASWEPNPRPSVKSESAACTLLGSY